MNENRLENQYTANSAGHPHSSFAGQLLQPGFCFPSQQDGVLPLNKPCGMTSATCLSQIKRILGQKKIGHAGSLDPMATGVLLVLLGQATKISDHLMAGGKKVYSGIIRLGIVTDTWDAEGKILESRPVIGVDHDSVTSAMSSLVGIYEQEVPAYSAAKHQGQPLYALARKGLAVPVKKKSITVLHGAAELVGPERVRFRVICGSGTYIRSLAHSLGMRLGCGAMLEELTREYSHPFGVSAAHTLDDVLADPVGFPAKVRGIDEALAGWPKLRLSREDSAKVRVGASVFCDSVFVESPSATKGGKALMLDADGMCLALAGMVTKNQKKMWKPLRGLWNP